MHTFRLLGCAMLVPFALCGQAPPQVSVTDHGAQTAICGPGAPAHIVGLPRTTHTIGMDTGVRKYGLSYVVAHDEKRPGVAIPGEGYIGMPEPENCNWYGGGFFDLQINGQTLGTTPIQTLGGRSSGQRGQVDFVFDTAMAVVRIRFVGQAGSDALYCQALLEPKTEITGLRLVLRCYPSAFVSNAERHVLTPSRDLAQGAKAELDPATECWLLYYDRVFDTGYATATSRGAGPCAVLWPGSQAGKVTFTVASYGIDTVMDLRPEAHDLRFVFFDFAGTGNETAMASLRQRAPGLLQELPAFAFTDAGVATWPLARKQQEITAALAAVPEDREAAAAYARWGAELETQLQLVRAGGAGAILAEAKAAATIAAWERGVPELKLKVLLRGI
jgi:hypothetical protein